MANINEMIDQGAAFNLDNRDDTGQISPGSLNDAPGFVFGTGRGSCRFLF